jgi:hypothetical protein
MAELLRQPILLFAFMDLVEILYAVTVEHITSTYSECRYGRVRTMAMVNATRIQNGSNARFADIWPSDSGRRLYRLQ